LRLPGLLIAALLLASLVPVYTAQEQQPQQPALVYTRSLAELAPVGAFRGYAIAYSPSGDLYAVDMASGSRAWVASLAALGVDPNASAFRYWRWGEIFALTDGASVAVFSNVSGYLVNVGRLALDNMAGFIVLPSGSITAWGPDYAVYALAYGYTYPRFYDLFTIVHRNITSSSAEAVLSWLGYNTTAIRAAVEEELRLAALRDNATSIDSLAVWFEHPPLNTTDPRAVRGIYRVVALGALVDDSYRLWALVGAVFPVRVRGEANYTVVQVVTAGNETVVEVYHRTAVLSSDIIVDRAFLLLFYPFSREGVIAEAYTSASRAAFGNALVYTYTPLAQQGLELSVLKVVDHSGAHYTSQYFLAGQPSTVWDLGDQVVFTTTTGVAAVYDKRQPAPARALFRGSVVDVEPSPAGVNIVYRNAVGAFEAGQYDRFSGQFLKIAVVAAPQAVGAYLTQDTRFLFVVRPSSVDIYSVAGAAELSVLFVDQLGRPVPSVWGSAVARSYGLSLTYSFSSNPAVLVVPVGSVVVIDAQTPYSSERFTLQAPPTPGRLAATLEIRQPASAPYTSQERFYSPFRSAGVVVAGEEQLARAVLPGATGLDAYGPLLAASSPEGYLTRVSLYRASGAGVEELWTTRLPSPGLRVKIYYPYLVAHSASEVYVLDASSGAVLYRAYNPGGFALDALGGYLYMYSDTGVRVVDLRRGTSTAYALQNVLAIAPSPAGALYIYTNYGVYVLDPYSGPRLSRPAPGLAVLSSAWDGYSSSVSYTLPAGGSPARYTDVYTCSGPVVVRDGALASAIYTVARGVASGARVAGDCFAYLVLTDSEVKVEEGGSNTSAARTRVYLVGAYASLVSEASAPPPRVSADGVAYYAVNNTIVLADTGLRPGVVVQAITPPLAYAASTYLLAYSDYNTTVVITYPALVGAYRVVVEVVDESGRPVAAEVSVAAANISAPSGRAEVFVTSPGNYTVSVTAEEKVPASRVVEVSDRSPVAYVRLVLRTVLYNVTVRVATPEGKEVREGSVSAVGPVSASLDLSRGERVLQLPRGNYTASFSAAMYTPATVEFQVPGAAEVLIVVNRTAIPIKFSVVDSQSQAPVANAVLAVVLSDRVLNLTTTANGTAVAVLPYLADYIVQASARGYLPFTSPNLTASEESTEVVIPLKRVVGSILVTVQDEAGDPETATVSVYTPEGGLVSVATVSGSGVISLPAIGAYTVEAVAQDGRKASTSVVLTEQNPTVPVTLVLPRPPPPLIVSLYPYLLIAVAAVTVVVFVLRRLRRAPAEKV